MLNFDDLLTQFTLVGFALVLVFCIFFIKSLLSQNPGTQFPMWLWAAGFLALLIFMRIPFISYNHELEVDESQMLAQAISLKKYWVYWKYVDGLTQGPLTIYFLIIPSWFGMPFDYSMVRLLGFIVLITVLLLTFSTFQNLFSRKVYLIIFAPIALFYVLSQGYFSALCNEYLVLLVLAFCFWLFSVIYNQPKPDSSKLFLISFVSGMVPFAKLQGVPTAILIVVFTGLIVMLRSDKKLKDLIVLFLGGITFPLIVLGLTVQFGAFDYFLNFYLIGNVQYSGGGTMLTKLLSFPTFLRNSGQFIILFISYTLLIASAALVLIRFKALGKSVSILFFFALAHVCLAFYSVIKPGYYFQHYLQFLIIPLGLFSGVLLEVALPQISWNLKKVWLASLGWLTICMLPHIIYKVTTTMGLTATDSRIISTADLGKPLEISVVSREIKKYLRAGDDITVWGWKPAYHIETMAAQGTADVMIYRIMTPAPMQKNYYEKYLNDMMRSKPVVFVDEVTNHSLWFNNPKLYRHENFKEIRNFIDKYYSHVSTVNKEKIYVRKDRLLIGQDI